MREKWPEILPQGVSLTGVPHSPFCCSHRTQLTWQIWQKPAQVYRVHVGSEPSICARGGCSGWESGCTCCLLLIEAAAKLGTASNEVVNAERPQHPADMRMESRHVMWPEGHGPAISESVL